MASIGPTAHYTGHVWTRNGLSHPELATIEGRALYLAAEAALLPLRLLGQPSLEGFLLARHLVIDELLDEAIAAGRVGQVLEIACGMSPRGWRFTERHSDLVYVEADLPAMAARKRAALEQIGRPDTHRVADIDALSADGPLSVSAVVAEQMDSSKGLAVITEGLLNYLSPSALRALWSNIAGVADLYLSDLFVAGDTPPLVGRA
ncbi:MAG: class I SAM-dependent methyltransferase, partial [Solirubrobacteraceae bacterium]